MTNTTEFHRVLAQHHHKLFSLLKSAKFDQFVTLQNDFYKSHIKKLETPEHHEQCFSMLDALNRVYGEILRKSARIKQCPPTTGKRKTIFLLNNIDTDLAHIALLGNLMRYHQPTQGEIYICGYGDPQDSPKSATLTSLAAQGLVTLFKIPNSHAGRAGLVNFIDTEGIDTVVIYSIPLLLSSWIEVFGSDRVIWLSTKFQLHCFQALSRGISLTTTSLSKQSKVWREILPGISADLPPALKLSGDRRDRLITINREEKIASTPFLKAVTEILKENGSATFSWTGRKCLAAVQGYFDAAGVAERCKFIGWIEPKRALAEHDIFLDTYSLSGYMSTMAFASGLPTFFFKDSQNWIQAHVSDAVTALKVDSRELVATDIEEYQAGVSKVIRSAENYLARAAMQKDFARRYLFREEQAWEELFQALQEA